ncbi:MAB_1171c family putative transporter [Streptomyces sp. B1866]|uniref:MAB_1171c family putative transporter n=1 Tax=Streptomyces sp. B1866 TaxID=3075431 RepID=UPI00288FBF51|nr:MAB_1171c family putative transporter [Streptomyces sp. B1866]MDT3397706.1 MAB_1171c family putative transporter [Streptomyces sp. B1866]
MENAVLVLLWAVALWRAPSAVRSARQRTLWAAFAALTGAMTLRVPDVMRAIDGAVGVNNLSTLLKHALGIVAAASVLEFVVVITRPEERAGARVRLGAAGAAMAAMGVLFAFVPRADEDVDFFERSAGSGIATAYQTVWLAYLGTAMAVATWLFWGSSRHAGAGWLRTGLRLLGAGTAAGVLYALCRAGYLLLRLTGAVGSGSDARAGGVTDVMKLLAIGLIVVGSSVPAVGVAWRGARHGWYLWRLRPLWRDLTAAVPEVVLDEELRRRELRMRLHRRVVEIRDAVLALHPYATADLRREAAAAGRGAGPGTASARATAEACWLETARRAKLAGRPPVDLVERQPGAPGDAVDLDAEARWLRAVGAARRGETVRRFAAARLEGSPGSPGSPGSSGPTGTGPGAGPDSGGSRRETAAQ